MTTITAPDGTTVDTRAAHERPTAQSSVFNVDPHHDVRVRHHNGSVWVDLGPLAIHASPDGVADQYAHLAEIGRAITAQAEAALGDLPAPEPVPAADRDALEGLVAAEEPTPEVIEPTDADGKVVDIMAALEQSIADAKAARDERKAAD